MNYSELYEKAWRIIWQHKVLWLFGILAGLTARAYSDGGAGSWIQTGYDTRDYPRLDPLSRAFPGLQTFFYNLERGFQDATIWPTLIGIGAALLCLIVIFWAISMVLGTFGRIGLVRGAWQADEGAARLRFGQLWHDSRSAFWRVLGLTLILMVLGWLVGIILFFQIILVAIFTLGCGLILIVPLLIIAAWLISIWIELTIVAIAGEDLGMLDGVRRGWEIIRRNLGPTIVVSLILFVGWLIASLIIAMPFLLIVLPVIVGVSAQTEAALMTGLITAGVLFLLYLPLAILLNGVVHAYIGTVWTLFFRRRTGRAAALAIQPPAPLEPAIAERAASDELPPD